MRGRMEVMAPRKTTKTETAPVFEAGGPSGPTEIPKTTPKNKRKVFDSPEASDASVRSDRCNPRHRRVEGQEPPKVVILDETQEPTTQEEPGTQEEVPNMVPDMPLPGDGRVTLTVPELLEVIQTALARERATWTGACEGERETLPKVPAPKKWSDVDTKRPMRKFLEEVEVWFDATNIKGPRRVKTLPTLLESTALEWFLAE